MKKICKDGESFGMVNRGNEIVSVKGREITLNNSMHITAIVQALNGIIYLIDGVLMPATSNNSMYKYVKK